MIHVVLFVLAFPSVIDAVIIVMITAWAVWP